MTRFLLPCLACLLAACGQKGPLYLPAPVPAPVVSPPAVLAPAQAAPAEKNEKDGQGRQDQPDTPAATPQP